MKKLRHVIWDVGEKNENPETLDFLKAQNSVLREVVKGLKKKVSLDTFQLQWIRTFNIKSSQPQICGIKFKFVKNMSFSSLGG